MGLSRKLFGWLYPKPTLRDIILQLNTLAEMLDFHAAELENQAEENRHKAAQYLKKDLKDQARFSMKMHLQYLAWGQELQTNRANVEGLSIRLQQGEYLKKTVEALGSVRSNLQNISKVLPNINGLALQADEISRAINQLQVAGRVTGSTMRTATEPKTVNESSVDEAMAKLEEEMGVNSFPDPLQERTSHAREEIKRLTETGSR